MSSLEKAGGAEGQCLVSHMFAVEPKSPCERSLGRQAPGMPQNSSFPTCWLREAARLFKGSQQGSWTWPTVVLTSRTFCSSIFSTFGSHCHADKEGALALFSSYVHMALSQPTPSPAKSSFYMSTSIYL